METTDGHIINQDTTDMELRIHDILDKVMDPEIPVISLIDLGVIRSIHVHPRIANAASDPALWEVSLTITPTYTGCPAMDVMKIQAEIALRTAGFTHIRIQQTLSPAWTTDWMSEKGRASLQAFGIAPPQPQQSVCTPGLFQEELAVPCPHCNSYNTRIVSRFGSTACKALYQCNDCQEPFDYFKCH